MQAQEVVAKRAAPDPGNGRFSRRRMATSAGPPLPVPGPGQPWQLAPPRAEDMVEVTRFSYDGRQYCYRTGGDVGSGGGCSTARVHAILRDNSVGPVVGWRSGDGQLSLDPGEWVGELLDATVLPGGGIVPEGLTEQEVTAGVERVGRGEAWVLPLGIGCTTVAAARAEVEELVARGRLHSRNHGQQAEVRNDLVGFLPLSEVADECEVAATPASAAAAEPDGTIDRSTGSGYDSDCDDDTEEGRAAAVCPPAIARCYRHLIQLAGLPGLATAVTGGAPLLLPPLGMAAVYDANDAKYVAHRDNDQLGKPTHARRNLGVLVWASRGDCHPPCLTLRYRNCNAADVMWSAT